METIFKNLYRGAALQRHLGIVATEDKPVKFGPWGDFVELGFSHVEDASGKLIEEDVKRNQFVYLVASHPIKLKEKFKALVVTNPALLELGQCPSILFLDDVDGAEYIKVPIQLRKDLSLDVVQSYLVRVYVTF
jgi:hypothetical protein